MNNPKECFRNMCNKTDRWFPNFWKINQKELDTIEKALDEHEQHKAIEQELGVDLITLFKALKEPAYVVVKDKIVETYCGHIGEECKTIDFEIDGKDYKNLYDIETFYVLTNEYGKTWALTREELEK